MHKFGAILMPFITSPSLLVAGVANADVLIKICELGNILIPINFGIPLDSYKLVSEEA